MNQKGVPPILCLEIAVSLKVWVLYAVTGVLHTVCIQIRGLNASNPLKTQGIKQRALELGIRLKLWRLMPIAPCPGLTRVLMCASNSERENQTILPWRKRRIFFCSASARIVFEQISQDSLALDNRTRSNPGGSLV